MVSIRFFFGVSDSGFEGFSEILLGISSVTSSLCSPCLYGFTNRTLRNCMMFAFFPSSWKEKYEKRQRETNATNGYPNGCCKRFKIHAGLTSEASLVSSLA